MGKKYNQMGRSKSHTFIMLRNHVFDSAAWHSLSPNARCAYIEIKRRYNGHNNGEIPLSCREVAERLNVSKASAKRALDDLTQAGFVKVGQDSSFDWKAKTSRRWILTEEVYDGKSPSNEWKNYTQQDARI